MGRGHGQGSVARAWGKCMAQRHGNRARGREMAKAWDYIGQGYRTRAWHKALGKGMGMEQGHGACRKCMWQGYGVRAWDRCPGKGMVLLDKGMVQGYGIRAWVKARPRAWDKCMGKRHEVGTCGKSMGYVHGTRAW